MLQHVHRFFLALQHDELSGFGFCLRGFKVLCHGDDGVGDFGGFGIDVEIEQSVAQADVAPHDAFAGLFFEATYDGRDAVSDGHNR